MKQFNRITIEQYNKGLLRNAIFRHPDPERSEGEGSHQRRDSSAFGLRMTQSRAFRNSPNNRTGVTLLELLIAITILGALVIGFSSIDTFSRYHVITSDRRAKLQNDASYVLEHMAKEIGKAIGDANQAAVDTTSGISGDAAIKVWIDSNPNGKRDGSDRQIAYRYRGSPDYQIWYYSNYSGSPASYEVIGKNISAFSCSLTDNYVFVEPTTCQAPGGTPACGSRDNPSVTMRNRIKMPAVSTH